jgi:hypothetical protein
MSLIGIGALSADIVNLHTCFLFFLQWLVVLAGGMFLTLLRLVILLVTLLLLLAALAPKPLLATQFSNLSIPLESDNHLLSTHLDQPKRVAMVNLYYGILPARTTHIALFQHLIPNMLFALPQSMRTLTLMMP